MATFLNCRTCKSDFSANADACPKCGDKNDWVNEKIQSLLRSKLCNGMKYETKGNRLEVVDKYLTPLSSFGILLALIALPLGLFSMALASLFLTIGMVLSGAGLFGHRAAKLEIDMSTEPPTCRCSNEQHFEEILKFLDVKVTEKIPAPSPREVANR